MSGLVASGKSTVAKALAEAIGAPLIVADEVRDDLLGLPLHARARDTARLENYAPELPEKVYDEVLQRAQRVLGAGHSVVLDACFGTRLERDALRALAAHFAAPLLFVECRAPEAVIRERLAARAARDAVALADWQAIASRFQADWEDPRELPATNHVLVDTTQPVSAIVTQLCHKLDPSRE